MRRLFAGVRALLYARGMTIMNRRNAVVGWATWSIFKQVLKRNAKADAAAAEEEEKRSRRFRRKQEVSRRRAEAAGAGAASAACSDFWSPPESASAPGSARVGAARRTATTLSSAAGAGVKVPPTQRCIRRLRARRRSRRPACRRSPNSSARRSRRAGFVATSTTRSTPDLVLNLIDPDAPKPFRRKSRGTFVAALYAQLEEPEDGLRQSYPMLVRALANIVLCYVPASGVWFTTMERGHYRVARERRRRRARGARSPSACCRSRRSRLVIDNEFRTDLEPELWDGRRAHRARSARPAGASTTLGLLPAPFPIEELLDERDLRHVKRLYGIGGLSYGNLSARKDETRFWMSASGVDKAKLDEPGPRHPARLRLRRRRTRG